MDRRNELLILKEDEVIDGGSRRRPGGELMPVDPDDAASAPFSDLRGSAADSPTRTGYHQCFAAETVFLIGCKNRASSLPQDMHSTGLSARREKEANAICPIVSTRRTRK
jgi:hypothetical protein